MAATLVDTFGRQIDYLRISLTDRCNFRCRYCLPAEGVPCLPRAQLLTTDEIVRVARLFLAMGGRRLKLTGGEPLMRPDVVRVVSALAGLPGLADLGLTTNGFYLRRLAPALRLAGLQRVNISLDSMEPARFAALTRSGSWRTVWAGIHEALRVQLAVKLNVVVMQGITEAELLQFGELARQHPVGIRFIEFMPLCGTGWRPDWMVPLAGVERLFRERFRLAPIPRDTMTAKTYRLLDGCGSIGFIASMTEPFCSRCSRLRLSADGQLRPCLFSHATCDLRTPMRAGVGDAALRAIIRRAVRQKPAGHGVSPQAADAVTLPRIRAFGG